MRSQARRQIALVLTFVLIASVSLTASGCLSIWPLSRFGQPPLVDKHPPTTPTTGPTDPGTTPVVTPPTPPETGGTPTPGGTVTGGKIDRTGAIPVVTSGPVGAKRVALTFDAGWIFEPTISLLNALDTAGVKATFFLRAAWIKDHPDLAREIAARGHEIESHSFAHTDFRTMTDDQIHADLDQARQVFRDVLNTSPTLFRPPYGGYNQHILSILAGYGFKASIMWTVDTIDWSDPGVDKIVERATSAADGSIVLMHLGGSQTVEALPQIIAGLRAKGLQPVTVSQLIGSALTAGTAATPGAH